MSAKSRKSHDFLPKSLQSQLWPEVILLGKVCTLSNCSSNFRRFFFFSLPLLFFSPISFFQRPFFSSSFLLCSNFAFPRWHPPRLYCNSPSISVFSLFMSLAVPSHLVADFCSRRMILISFCLQRRLMVGMAKLVPSSTLMRAASSAAAWPLRPRPTH